MNRREGYYYVPPNQREGYSHHNPQFANNESALPHQSQSSNALAHYVIKFLIFIGYIFSALTLHNS